MLCLLPCQHGFCHDCSKTLVKVTTVKKSNVPLVEAQEGEQSLKCPKCLVVHLVGEMESQNWQEVAECEKLKKELTGEVDPPPLDDGAKKSLG